jgi:hypothetical protein
MTIQDLQVALRIYLTSLVAGGISKPNGQSDPLKASLKGLIPYKAEVLNLVKSTSIADIPVAYRSLVEAAIVELAENSQELSPVLVPTGYRFPFVKLEPSLSETETYLTFSLVGLPLFYREKIVESQRVDLFKGLDVVGQGRITQVAFDIIRVVIPKSLGETHSFTEARLSKWWNSRDSFSSWKSEVCFVPSTFSAYLDCLLFETNTLYSTAWSLYYGSDLIEVAKGVDNVKSGRAYLTKPLKLFKPGAYVLKGNLVKKRNQVVRSKTLKFNLTTESLYLI